MYIFKILLKIILLLSMAYVIGTERAHAGKVIGFRSTAILLLGSFLYTHIALQVGGDVTRIIAQVITGISFVGAGIIFKKDDKDIHNLTTAILVWTLSSVGIMVGLSMIVEAIVITLIILAVLAYKPTTNDNNGS